MIEKYESHRLKEKRCVCMFVRGREGENVEERMREREREREEERMR